MLREMHIEEVLSGNWMQHALHERCRSEVLYSVTNLNEILEENSANRYLQYY